MNNIKFNIKTNNKGYLRFTFIQQCVTLNKTKFRWCRICTHGLPDLAPCQHWKKILSVCVFNIFFKSPDIVIANFISLGKLLLGEE